MIGFNVPIFIDESIECIKEAINKRKICGDGEFTKKCSEWMEEKFNSPKILLTTSCTSALEMAAILLDIKPGDEVIMPSYTFVSTADAFVMVGAKVIFVDVNPKTMNIDENEIEKAITPKTKAIVVVHYAGISPDIIMPSYTFVSTADAFVMVGAKVIFVDVNPKTMNIDENEIEKAITPKTKAIVVVHYAGISPDMDKIMEISKKYNLKVVEDAAQGFMAKYKEKYR